MTGLKLKLSILIYSFICFSSRAFAVDFSPINSFAPRPSTFETKINLNSQKGTIKIIDLKSISGVYDFSDATDRFVQCNIKASWEDFKRSIEKDYKNDFFYLNMANKMSNLGFFDLSDLAISKVTDKKIGESLINAVRRFYYPSKKLNLENELLLAEVYSNIIYNNQSAEASKELVKNSSLLTNSDYANYILALGYYKSNNFSKALKYVETAISKSSSTLNYQKLKAEILAEMKREEAAMRVVSSLKKQNLNSYEYERKINSLEHYILYKTKKADWEKNYHLGYYYYLENDSSKALRTLQSALSVKAKRDSALVYSLISEIHLDMKNLEKASEEAQKAYRLNKNNTQALMVLGDLSYDSGDYEKALKYYKQAGSRDKKSYHPVLKEALVWQKLSNEKKAMDIYSKVIKYYPQCWEAYYYKALIDKANEIEDLKMALAINPLFKDAWMELAKISIEKQNYEDARNYLSNVFCIDENDFRYYYYQGVVEKNTGNCVEAEYNFKKCLKFNSRFELAKKELNRESAPILTPIVPISQIK